MSGSVDWLPVPVEQAACSFCRGVANYDASTSGWNRWTTGAGVNPTPHSALALVEFADEDRLADSDGLFTEQLINGCCPSLNRLSNDISRVLALH